MVHIAFPISLGLSTREVAAQLGETNNWVAKLRDELEGLARTGPGGAHTVPSSLGVEGISIEAYPVRLRLPKESLPQTVSPQQSGLEHVSVRP